MSSGMLGQALCRLPSKCVGQGRSVKCLKGLRTSATSRLSTQEPEAKQQEQPPYFKTQETCPLKHDQRHLGRIYTVDSDTINIHGVGVKERAPNWPLSIKAIDHHKAMGEYSLLLRRPMIETTNYIQQLRANRANPDNKAQTSLKIIFWGEDGAGKSTSLFYATDFCHQDGYIILNFHKFRLWYDYYQEMQESQWKSGRYDHITKSQVFLKEFIIVNKDKLADLKTHAEYTWSGREKTEAGSPLMSVVETGVTRPNFAADALGVLFKELRLHCQEAAAPGGDPEACKVALVVDGMSRLFVDKTQIDRQLPLGKEKKRSHWKTAEQIQESIVPDELSVVRNIKKMLNPELPNTVVLGSTDIVDVAMWGTRLRDQEDALQAKMVPETQSYYPFALLGQEGWEALDPFLPMEVGRYTSQELDTMIDYHVERRYLLPEAASEAGRAEIHFLTARHPGDFVTFSPEW